MAAPQQADSEEPPREERATRSLPGPLSGAVALGRFFPGGDLDAGFEDSFLLSVVGGYRWPGGVGIDCDLQWVFLAAEPGVRGQWTLWSPGPRLSYMSAFSDWLRWSVGAGIGYRSLTVAEHRASATFRGFGWKLDAGLEAGGRVSAGVHAGYDDAVLTVVDESLRATGVIVAVVLRLHSSTGPFTPTLDAPLEVDPFHQGWPPPQGPRQR